MAGFPLIANGAVAIAARNAATYLLMGDGQPLRLGDGGYLLLASNNRLLVG